MAFVGLIVRLAYIFAIPDYDGDAYAHYEFAARVVERPTDLSVHWVWLPGFHYVVAALQALGTSFRGVRIANALLQTAGPFLLHRASLPRESERVALGAGVLWGASSLANLLGTTALAETLFTLLVVAACGLVDAGRRPVLAGLALTAACALRYEAWFATAIFGSWWVITSARTRAVDRKIFIAAAIPSICVLVYVILRRAVDGEWLWFIRETYRFTHMQRGLSTHSRLFEILWLPVIVPAMLLGPAVALVPFGFARGRPSHPIVAGLALFVALTYFGNGTLGHARYLTVLMPFACVMLARACERFRAVAIPAAISVTIASGAYLGYVARGALAESTDLRAREARANGFRH